MFGKAERQTLGSSRDLHQLKVVSRHLLQCFVVTTGFGAYLHSPRETKGVEPLNSIGG